MVTWVLFISFILCLILNLPIGIALGMSSVVAMTAGGSVEISFLVRSLVTANDSFPLMAVPFFILAGELMGKGGISARLINTANVFFGRYTGGLATVTVVTCMFFAAISGSGPATVAAVGGIMAPAMMKRGYGKSLPSGIIASAGSIGVIIPPSIPMVIYCVTSGVSITSLFLAGFIPGLVIGLGLIVYSWAYSKKHGFYGDEKRYTIVEQLSIIWESKWALLVPVIILGGIYGGIFTPTEAAAIAVIYGFIVGRFVYKDLGNKEIFEVFRGAALTTGTVLIILGTAATFGRILTLEQIPTRIAAFIQSVTDSRILVLLMINILLLIVGCFMETLAAIIILTPILLPLVTQVGVDPLHFGIVMVVNLAIGFITPPLGVNLFVACGITKQSLEEMSKAILGPLAVMIVILMFLTYIPEISLFLPKLLNGYIPLGA